MSLEAAIQENTSVLRELLARLSGAIVAAPAPAAPTTEQVEEKKPDAAPAPTPPVPPTEPVATAQTATVTVAASEPITYDQVSKAIMDGVKADRAQVLAVLAQFGVKKGPELKPEQYGAFLAAMG